MLWYSKSRCRQSNSLGSTTGEDTSHYIFPSSSSNSSNLSIWLAFLIFANGTCPDHQWATQDQQFTMSIELNKWKFNDSCTFALGIPCDFILHSCAGKITASTLWSSCQLLFSWLCSFLNVDLLTIFFFSSSPWTQSCQQVWAQNPIFPRSERKWKGCFKEG